jgi:prepilin-type processing-associated H-X9-DG protein
MKIIDVRPKSQGMTLVEVLVVIATIMILAGVILPAIAPAPHFSERIRCLNNLKQIGIGFRIWSSDHGDRFPWNVPQKEGGTLEYALSPEVFRHFKVASNELNTPKILVCPDDRTRTRTASFQTDFSNSNLSYFIGLDADETKPQTILCGDRTLSTNKTILSGLVLVHDPQSLRWAAGIHQDGGNIALADGSAQQFNPTSLLKSLRSQTNLPIHLTIP